MRRSETRRPTTPLYKAGMRTEPPMSLPCAESFSFRATPRTERFAPCGLRASQITAHDCGDGAVARASLQGIRDGALEGQIALPQAQGERITRQVAGEP